MMIRDQVADVAVFAGALVHAMNGYPRRLVPEIRDRRRLRELGVDVAPQPIERVDNSALEEAARALAAEIKRLRLSRLARMPVPRYSDTSWVWTSDADGLSVLCTAVLDPVTRMWHRRFDVMGAR